MRIAISGSHRTGKTSLVEALASRLRGYVSVAEPYHGLVEDGYEFAQPPSLEDFEAQLEWSIERLSEGERDVLFDRCPLDFLAYIAEHEEADAFDRDEWLPRIGEAVESLDLVVYVPIEPHDRLGDAHARAAVNERLAELLDGSEVELLEVHGETSERVAAVLKSVGQR